MNATRINSGMAGNDRLLTLLLPVVGVALLSIFILASGFKLLGLTTVLCFALGFAVLLNVPALQALPATQRLILILLVLRPLVDIIKVDETSGSSLSLQNVYAALFAGLLIIGCWKQVRLVEFLRVPYAFLAILIGLSGLAWVQGGLSAGSNAFARTEWGLLVGLLAGALFAEEEEIHLFIRAVFYSSMLVLVILLFNLQEGDYFGTVWRLGGQYVIPNTLAAVALSLFAFGLYTFSNASGITEKVLSSTLLALLAVVITFTQSRTVGGLLILSFFLWLWARDRAKAIYAFLGGTCVVLVSKAVSEWRLTSSFSLQTKEFSEDIVNMTGRTFLWAKTLENYIDANRWHKLTGLGWGTMFDNFRPLGLEEVSSVTENSFLWFFVGAGAIAGIAFLAYLIWVFRKSLTSWRKGANAFERQLGFLVLVATLIFIIEGATTDIVLSPVANVYLYSAISIFVSYRLKKAATPSFPRPELVTE